MYAEAKCYAWGCLLQRETGPKALDDSFLNFFGWAEASFDDSCRGGPAPSSASASHKQDGAAAIFHCESEKVDLCVFSALRTGKIGDRLVDQLE